MEELLEKIEALIDDIERDSQLSKSEIVNSLNETKELLENYIYTKNNSTLEWDDLD